MAWRLELQVMGGLFSRFRAVVGAYGYCETTGRNLIVNWPHYQPNLPNGFEARLSDVWKHRFREIDKKSVWNKNRQDLHSDKPVVRFRSCEVSDFYEWHRKPVSHYLSAFPLSDAVCEMVSETWEHFIPPMVGVHIRHDMKQPETAPLEWFLTRMEQIANRDTDVTFFLSADDRLVSRQVHTRFPGRVVEQTKTYRYDLQGIQRSAADVYLLGQTEWMIGSNRSSMSQMAGFLRGGRDAGKWRMTEGRYEDYWNRPDEHDVIEALSCM